MTASHSLPEVREVDDRLVDRFRSVVTSVFDSPSRRGERRVAEFAGLARESVAETADELEVGRELGVLKRVHPLAERDHELVDAFVERRVVDE